MIIQIIVFGVLFFYSTLGFSDEPKKEVAKTQQPKFDCEFSKYKNWKDIIKFEKKPIQIYETDKHGIEYNKSITVYKLGNFIAGSCKGSEIYAAYYVWTDCIDKPSSGEPPVLATDIPQVEDFEDEPSWSPYTNMDCGGTFIHMINHKEALFTSWSSDFDKELEKKFNKKVIYSEFADYQRVIFKETLELKSPKLKTKLKFNRNKYSITRFEHRTSFFGYEVYVKDPIEGTFLISGRKAVVVLPNHIVSPLDAGLIFEKEDYYYAGFLAGLKNKIDIYESNLLPVKGEKNTYTLGFKKRKLLKLLHKEYVKRVDYINKEVIDKNGYTQTHKITPLSFKEYVKAKPLVFIKDSLNRYQVFNKRLHYEPKMSEPLIYIYADKKTQMNIKLCSHLKLTASYPKYNNSWDVVVEPNKKLKNLDNNRYYSTLFWEGYAGYIPPYDQGWVVRSNEVEELFKKILPEYGLNETETREFMTYWVPKLSTAPFYQIEILPQTWVDKVCPLGITPKPKSYLRVHMRAYPLAEYRIIPEPKKPAKFKRDGLTVVEWSGIYN